MKHALWSRLCVIVFLGSLSSALAAEDESDMKVSAFWQARQAKYEKLEAKYRQQWQAFDSPPKFIYTGTDDFDKTPAFYAPIQTCRYLPEFQTISTTGTAGQYFKHTLAFGMKDIIRFHGHSCEHLYYAAAICRLICDRLFPNEVVDRTVLRGMCGKSPCGIDSLCYITGGRLQYGTVRVDPTLGHTVVLQRMDTGETWMGVWKDGVNSWNAVNIFGKPNKNNPAPYKRWSGWKGEPDTPKEQLRNCRRAWAYDRPELLQRLRDLKDNLKYLPKGEKPRIDPNEVREEFEWLQYRHLKQVFSHPLEESFQIKRVPDFKWEYPHVEPLWIPRLDQKGKWAPVEPHPAKDSRGQQ